MMIDLTLAVTPHMKKDAQGNLQKAFTGHLGTHFDVMNKVFPLDFCERRAIVFDVRQVKGRDIEPEDAAVEKIQPGMFVMFATGFMQDVPYGTKTYFQEHPQLSRRLLDLLVEKKVALVGIDFAGVRRGAEHTPTDQYFADHGIFIIENLCHLEKVSGKTFTAITCPMNFTDMTGLPCRVIAKV